ncbi:UNVERIFIED_ORG: DNA primase catalytic core [Pseudomonas reinekei]
MPRIDYNQLLNSVSIEDVANRLGMKLQKTSPHQFKALCPFHDDKTPSLLVDVNRSQGRQHFYCFSCGANGDAIDLVKQKLNLGFKEAVDWLDPHNRSVATGPLKTSAHKTDLPNIDLPALQFGYNLYKKNKDQEELDSWMAARQLDPTTLKQAGFTYAPQNYLSKLIASQKDRSTRREFAGDLEDAFLIRKLIPGIKTGLHLPFNLGEDLGSQYSDFFISDRIIFPIHDENGKLLGIAGRKTGGDDNPKIPKYQFTRAFPKSNVLYRADFAFKLIKSMAKNNKKIIPIYLCEGFLDALRFESLGFPAVAIMGSSISEKQVKLLSNLNNALPKDTVLKVIISFDRDEAGLRGAADAFLKITNSAIECAFLWPLESDLPPKNRATANKDPNDYLCGCTIETASQLLENSTLPPELTILAYSFGINADEVLDYESWISAPRTRRTRAFTHAFSQLEKAVGSKAESLLKKSLQNFQQTKHLQAIEDWLNFINDSQLRSHKSQSEDFIKNSKARLNHSRILAYMGSRRGELPCDEPRWERLDIAATAFNTLLLDRLGDKNSTQPIGSYNAVWVPRSFGGDEPRLKIMPRPEDLIIQQYILNEILTERWDAESFTDIPFSNKIPAVRFYREEHTTITTGFDAEGNGNGGALSSQTLSFAYQIDMDVIEGRQPATDQGMYRPFSECWRDFMKSLTDQATEIGYVHSIRLDVKRYYDRIRRYVVRDRLLNPLQSAIASVHNNTPDFAELISYQEDVSSNEKAATILDHIDEHLFDISYAHPDTGLDEKTDPLIGIPQGPVLSAWIGSVALFPVDEEAFRLMSRLNVDKKRVGYARYVDDIVLLADDPVVLSEIRDAIDLCARKLELTLLAKADEIPAMSAEDFASYINQGRALVAYGPAWEPPLVGDGESGWDFWSIAPATDRQSALQLLHNVELYKASKSTLIRTVRTAFQAPDLRASELPKAARLVWYAIAVEQPELNNSREVLNKYLDEWNDCIRDAAWSLQPERNKWESPILFALEGLEHLIDKQSRDIAELTADENSLRRHRISWLADLALTPEFDRFVFDSTPGPKHQLDSRLNLVRWKALRLKGKPIHSLARLNIERSKLVQSWRPFEWMHEAVSLLSDSNYTEEDQLAPFINPVKDQSRAGNMFGLAAEIFIALLPNTDDEANTDNHQTALAASIALQTIASIVPKEHLSACLTRRNHLIWPKNSAASPNRVIIPPLPGIKAKRLFSCTGNRSFANGSILAKAIEAIEFTQNENVPVFFGSDAKLDFNALQTEWTSETLNDSIFLLHADLLENEYIYLREKLPATSENITSQTLKIAAALFRSIAKIVSTYAENNEEKELVPAWPYIATDENSLSYYLIADGVPSDELGNRAFIRDGGRALRTAEVPIYEARLWRVGVAISDFLGLYDDVTKFGDHDTEIILDSSSLANPARYVLRSQLRKLRGAYADSSIGNRRVDDGSLPSTVSRSLRLLELFPESGTDPLVQILHVLTVEAESAGMHLAYRKTWQDNELTSFLLSLTNKVLKRLPLSVGEALSIRTDQDDEARRDLSGLLCFARRLFSIPTNPTMTELPAWKALRAGVISTGIFVAFEGLIASLRSHGSFERYENADFPTEWNIAPADPLLLRRLQRAGLADAQNNNIPLIEQCRRVSQHLGHRLNLDENNTDRISKDLYNRLYDIAIKLSQIEYQPDEESQNFEWPFELINETRYKLLTLDLLESTSKLVSLIDHELGFEKVLVIEKTFGYNAQSKRFTDSRGGVRDVTPWMISHFPPHTNHIEEVSSEGHFFRIWTEVFDRNDGRLLSVSALGEPFASIAIIKPQLNFEHKSERSSPLEKLDSPKTQQEDSKPRDTPANIPIDNKDQKTLKNQNEENSIDSNPANNSEAIDAQKNTASNADNMTTRKASAFRRQQADQWTRRGESCKPQGLVRIALLQADFDLTYQHPFTEASLARWPFGEKSSEMISVTLRSDSTSTHGQILRAAERHDTAHLWTSLQSFPSWSEHRRRAILRRVIDSCQNFGVDLLVLPEYSVRRETIEWLKTYIINKDISVLAGTYLNVSNNANESHLIAPLTLLWPLPQAVSNVFINSLQQKGLGTEKDYDSLRRGNVFSFSRGKKYRSIALEEFFRPSVSRLEPLFNISKLAKEIETETGFEPSAEVISHLLTKTRLPLKYLLELICSEAFLVSSPANYLHMGEDLKAMWARFGRPAAEREVLNDVEALSKKLLITGDGIEARRSILAVPAATSRSADYWFAGQAGFLAAGTTTVFCNSIDGKTLVGGSCFIGRGSWKSEETTFGYISKITPYHGWSKGIYYNNKEDTLSKKDQALVIADVDPHNMLEGKPRAQTMPSPLQLVAYLPLVESIDWEKTQPNLLRSLSPTLTANIVTPQEKSKNRPQEETDFWSLVDQLRNNIDDSTLDKLWRKFSDPNTLISRAAAHSNNGDMQPTAPKSSMGLLTAPAFYDWIDVSLTLNEQQELPMIAVPPWKFPNI